MTYSSCRAIDGVAFCAAPAAVPMEMGMEPWRERPRLGAMNASRAPPGVVHATVPGVGDGVAIRGAVGPEIRSLRDARLS